MICNCWAFRFNRIRACDDDIVGNYYTKTVPGKRGEIFAALSSQCCRCVLRINHFNHLFHGANDVHALCNANRFRRKQSDALVVYIAFSDPRMWWDSGSNWIQHRIYWLVCLFGASFPFNLDVRVKFLILGQDLRNMLDGRVIPSPIWKIYPLKRHPIVIWEKLILPIYMIFFMFKLSQTFHDQNMMFSLDHFFSNCPFWTSWAVYDSRHRHSGWLILFVHLSHNVLRNIM